MDVWMCWMGWDGDWRWESPIAMARESVTALMEWVWPWIRGWLASHDVSMPGSWIGKRLVQWSPENVGQPMLQLRERQLWMFNDLLRFPPKAGGVLISFPICYFRQTPTRPGDATAPNADGQQFFVGWKSGRFSDEDVHGPQPHGAIMHV